MGRRATTGQRIRGWGLTILLTALPGVTAADEEMGWTPEHIPPAEPWREQDTGLPAFPDSSRLLEVSDYSGDFPYRVSIDPDSLAVGADGVVRYTVVVVSTAGAKNISFEGIRCKTREFRRYAYGVNAGWQRIESVPWQPVRDGGMGHYRNVLWRDYLCDAENPGLKPDEMLRRIRYSPEIMLDD